MLHVETLTLRSITVMRPLAEAIGRRDRSLADQLRRAATSIALNTAEGVSSLGGNKTARFATAAGSARETVRALEVAIAWGYIRSAEARTALEMLDRIGAMLYRLRGAGR